MPPKKRTGMKAFIAEQKRAAAQRAAAGPGRIGESDRSYIRQGHMGISASRKGILYLSTTGISPCVGLAIWQNGKGLLTHLDSESTWYEGRYLESYIPALLDKMALLDEPVRVTIITSSVPESRALGRTVNALISRHLPPDVQVDMQSRSFAADVALDLEDGSVIDYREPRGDIDGTPHRALYHHVEGLTYFALTCGEVVPIELPEDEDELDDYCRRNITGIVGRISQTIQEMRGQVRKGGVDLEQADAEIFLLKAFQKNIQSDPSPHIARRLTF